MTHMVTKIAAVGALALAVWFIADGFERRRFIVWQEQQEQIAYERWVNLEDGTVPERVPSPHARDRSPAYVRLGAGASFLVVGLFACARLGKRKAPGSEDAPGEVTPEEAAGT
jgi:hypothetical protein